LTVEKGVGAPVAPAEEALAERHHAGLALGGALANKLAVKVELGDARAVRAHGDNELASADVVVGLDVRGVGPAVVGEEQKVVAVADARESEVARVWAAAEVEHALPCTRDDAGEGEGGDEGYALIGDGDGAAEVEVAGGSVRSGRAAGAWGRVRWGRTWTDRG